jgi:hypothetical protein
MSTSAKIAVTGLALAVAVAFLAWRSPPAPDARVAGPRLARTSARPLDEGPQVLDLDAARGALAGVVVNAAGQPIEGAFVAATPEGISGADEERLARARAVVRTVRGGRFDIDQLPPGRYGLTAVATRFAGASLSGVVLLPGEHLRGLELKLASGGMTVRGRVLDNGAGAIPRADVRAVTLGKPSRLYQMTAADDGTFILTLPDAVYAAVATAGGYASSSLELIPTPEQSVIFRLNPAGQLRGRVVERGSTRPVAGALVTATVAELPWVDPREATADAEGRFAFADLEPGRYALTASKDLLAGRLSAPARVAAEGPSPEAVILVDRAAIVSGRVRDERGQGVPGVALRLLPGRSWSAGHRVLAESGQDGAFRIVGVQPGRFTLLAERPPHAPAEQDLVIDDGRDRQVDLTLPAGAVLAGVVQTRESQPVAGAVVTALVNETSHGHLMGRRWPQVRTGADGRFRVEALPAGEALVSAAHAGKAASWTPAVVLPVGQTREVTITLGTDTTTVAGTVRWDDGSPAAGVGVAAGWSLPGARGLTSTRTGADGTYHIGRVHPGEVTVLATRGKINGIVVGHGLPHQALVTIADGEARTDVDLVLPRAGLSIGGVVVDESGTGREGVAVSARAAIKSGEWRYDSSAKPAEAMTAADGTFVVDELDPGTYELTARHVDAPIVQHHDVSAGARGVRITLPTEAIIAGKVVGDDGKPVASFSVHPVRHDNQSSGPDHFARLSATEARDGAFELRRLPPGRYDLVATTGDGRSGRFEGITVAAGQSRRDVLVQVGAGATVTVKVLQLGSDAPVVGARVSLRVADGPVATAETNGEGRAELTGLPPGLDASLVVEPVSMGTFVPDKIRVTTPEARATADLGVLKVLPNTQVTPPATGRVGLRLERRGSTLLVENVGPRTPAERAGIKPGDVIVSVNDTDVRGLGSWGATRLVLGPPGTSVSLGLTGPRGPRTVALVREDLTPKSN